MRRVSAITKAAVIQLQLEATSRLQLDKAEQLIAQAAGAGATLVLLPERFAQWTQDSLGETLAPASPCYVPAWLSSQAREHGIYLIGGSVLELEVGAALPYNISLVYAPDGTLRAKYRKIHLFDAMVEGVAHGESSTILPGGDIVCCDTPAGTIGLSICYDIRFPELYRALADRDARVLSVPAGFTRATGRAHWEILLRARAIENQCFVVAAGMVGYTSPAHDFYGHSMIVDPWGTIIAEVSDGEGVAIADLDLKLLDDVRARLPSLANRRLRQMPAGPLGA